MRLEKCEARGNTGKDDVRFFLDHGVNAVLPKPLDMNVLTTTLGEVLESMTLAYGRSSGRSLVRDATESK